MELEKQYLEFDEYRLLGGTLDETPFSILELQAQKEIDKYTFGRLKELPEQIKEVKVCIYRLIEMFNNYNSIDNTNVASENIDGYSVSYISKTEALEKTKRYEIMNIIKTYLAECRLDNGTPYLYAGV